MLSLNSTLTVQWHQAAKFIIQIFVKKLYLADLGPGYTTTDTILQVAQLWQRDRAKLDTFSINVEHDSQNHTQNCIFGPPYGGIRGNICTFLTQKKSCSRVSS